MKQLSGFSAKRYYPDEWVKLIKNAGAKYAVITTKHHDGVSLWNTKQSKSISTLQNSFARKDVLTPFVASLKNAGIKTGLYFSLPDWSHPDYDVFTRVLKKYDYKKEVTRFDSFIHLYQNQLRELSENYRPDLLWFDGDWEHSAEEWKTVETKRLLQSYNSEIIINSRLTNQGDYATPEQGIPVTQPNSKYWELCYTMNDSWGYQPLDQKYKSSNQLIRTLVDCISLGGNLLLDIGPKEDGTIPQKQIDILKDMGRWTHKHAQAIYGTIPFSVGKKIFDGKTATKKDSSFFYVYLDYKPNEYVVIQNPAFVTNECGQVESVEVIGHKEKLSFKNTESHCVIHVPDSMLDRDVTVLKVNYLAPKSTKHMPAISSYLKDKEAPPQVTIHQIIDDLKKGNNPLSEYNITLNKTQTLPSFLHPQVYNWVKKHAELFTKDMNPNVPYGYFNGATILSKDSTTLYLFIEGKPTGPILVKGLKNEIARIRIVGDGSILNDYTIYDKLYWSATPGILSFYVPDKRLDKYVTVIAILLNAPVDLYSGEVKAIESNL